jgi:hypothetical protein
MIRITERISAVLLFTARTTVLAGMFDKSVEPHSLLKYAFDDDLPAYANYE